MRGSGQRAAVAGLLLCLLSTGMGAKPANVSFGLSKGNHTEEAPEDVWNGMFFLNTAGNGHISRVQLLVDDRTPAGLVRMAVYWATPCILEQELGYATVVDGWVSIDGLDIPVTARSCYYLAFDLESPNEIRIRKKASDFSYSAPWPYDGEWIRRDSAVDMPTGGTISDSQYVMRAIVVPD